MKELSKTERTLSARDFGEFSKTPEEVARQVKEDFRLRGMSLSDAARKLGVFRQVVSVQLSGKSYLSKIASEAYKRVFGFSYDFLRHGHGFMYEDTDLNNIFLGDCDNDYDLSRKMAERELFVKNLKEKKVEELQVQYADLQYSFDTLEKNYRDLQKLYNELSAILVRVVVRDRGAIDAVRPPKDGEKDVPDTEYAERIYQYLMSLKPSSSASEQVSGEKIKDL